MITQPPASQRPVTSVRTLHSMVANFGRTPESSRPAQVARIKEAAEQLGASELGWVKSFLARNAADTKAPGARPIQQGPPNAFALKHQ